MSGGMSYAAAVSTPNGVLRQPQIQARACSDLDLRSSFESPQPGSAKERPQRPGAGIRAKTSFRGWSKKGKDAKESERSALQGAGHENCAQHTHVTREEHRPNIINPKSDVYILTLKLEESISRPMDQLRSQYFPKRLNRTPAHLTLFHALPHSYMEALENDLNDLATGTQPFNVATGGAFRMRKGIGVNVDAGYQNMKDVHAQLRSQWLGFLSEQDAGGFRPHWTVMNKVNDEEEIDNAFGTVRKQLAASAHEGKAIGLELWKYDRGNWIWSKKYDFVSSRAALPPTVVSSTNVESSSSTIKSSHNGKSTGAAGKRPSLKRGSSVAEAWRSMSFRRKS